MPPVGHLRKQLQALKNLNQQNFNLFQEQSSGRSRNRYVSRYRQQILNLEKKIRNAFGQRSGLGLELNRARNNLKKLKSNEERNKIKVREAPQKYRSVHYGSAYGGFNRVLPINYFNSLPKNEKNAVEKKLKAALNAHNKKIENAEKRVKNIEKQAAEKAALLLEQTPVISRKLYEPGTGILYRRLLASFGKRKPNNNNNAKTPNRNTGYVERMNKLANLEAERKKRHRASVR